MPIDPRDFGRLESEVESLRSMIQETKDTLVVVQAKLDQINSTLSEARGGWRLMMLVGGAAASLGGAASWIASHMSWNFKP